MDYSKKIQLIEEQLSKLNEESIKIDTILKAKTESFNSVADIFEINRDKTAYDISVKLGKEILPYYLEHYRANSQIIRKLSIDASDYLDSEISEAEGLQREFLRACDERDKTPTDENRKMVHQLSKQNKDKHSSIERSVILARKCIKGTLDKIKE